MARFHSVVFVCALLQPSMQAVKDGAKIINKDRTWIGLTNGYATFECLAKGNPPPTVTWYNPNGIEITNDLNAGGINLENTVSGDRVEGYVIKSRMSIYQSGSWLGVYRCSATNNMETHDFHEIHLLETDAIYSRAPAVYTADPNDLARSNNTPVVLGIISGALLLTMVIVCSCWQCLACAKLSVQGESTPTSTEPNWDDVFDYDAPPSYDEVLEMDSDTNENDEFPPKYDPQRACNTAGLCWEDRREAEHCI
ncbi:uncharacterized protein LOC110989833 [Acanthaster planci]|uniref:Uncharacterized protein LOC110989833 n=1 Tax=Acanthaster planci TaxID=133434 RepID=A0A8B7ZYL2_ACAPL|nr:uncharacterized protein LOC110989833 [Acanthaster planci]